MPLELPSHNAAQRLWRWIKNQVVQDVPKDISVCEFDCRKEQCLQDEWETCERRLSGAAGQLKPTRDPQSGHTETGPRE